MCNGPIHWLHIAGKFRHRVTLFCNPFKVLKLYWKSSIPYISNCWWFFTILVCSISPMQEKGHTALICCILKEKDVNGLEKFYALITLHWQDILSPIGMLLFLLLKNLFHHSVIQIKTVLHLLMRHTARCFYHWQINVMWLLRNCYNK